MEEAVFDPTPSTEVQGEATSNDDDNGLNDDLGNFPKFDQSYFFGGFPYRYVSIIMIVYIGIIINIQLKVKRREEEKKRLLLFVLIFRRSLPSK